MIYVTHDQVEAMTMADRIVVLNKGNIEQVGSPLELYNKPDSLFVAGFIGSPKMNLYRENRQPNMTPDHRHPARASRAFAKDGNWTAMMLAEHLGSDTFLHVDAGPRGTLTVRASGEFPPGPAARSG